MIKVIDNKELIDIKPNENGKVPFNIIAQFKNKVIIETDLVDLGEEDINLSELTNFRCIQTGLEISSKQLRALEVENIKVTVNNKVFDGDETSQTRMSRAITSMSETDTINWKLADDSFAEITKAELVEALKLAGIEQTNIWVKYV